jgi:hypothetical protein
MIVVAALALGAVAARADGSPGTGSAAPAHVAHR